MLIPRPRYKRKSAAKLQPHPKTMTAMEAIERGLIRPNPDSQLARDIEAAMVRSQNRPLPTQEGSAQDKTPPSALGDAFDTNGRTR